MPGPILTMWPLEAGHLTQGMGVFDAPWTTSVQLLKCLFACKMTTCPLSPALLQACASIHMQTHTYTHIMACVFLLLLLLPCLWQPWQHTPAAMRRWHSCCFSHPLILLIKTDHIKLIQRAGLASPRRQWDIFPREEAKGTQLENLHFKNKQIKQSSVQDGDRAKDPRPLDEPSPDKGAGDATWSLQPLWQVREACYFQPLGLMRSLDEKSEPRPCKSGITECIPCTSPQMLDLTALVTPYQVAQSHPLQLPCVQGAIYHVTHSISLRPPICLRQAFYYRHFLRQGGRVCKKTPISCSQPLHLR